MNSVMNHLVSFLSSVLAPKSQFGLQCYSGTILLLFCTDIASIDADQLLASAFVYISSSTDRSKPFMHAQNGS